MQAVPVGFCGTASCAFPSILGLPYRRRICVCPPGLFYDHGTLVGFISGPDSPWTYLARNALLQMNQHGVRSFFASVPYPSYFNGSLWTLQYEFLCYLSVAGLGIVAVLRRVPLIVRFFLWAVLT